MDKPASPLTADQIRQLHREALNRRVQAKKDVADATKREQEAIQEIEAVRVLARLYHGLDLPSDGQQAAVTRQAAPAGSARGAGPAKDLSIAELMAEYLRLHPEASPITPTEMSEGIEQQWGRKIDSASITTTRARNEALFEKVEVPNKRGAFQLRQQPEMKEKKKTSD